jgi:type IV pilus assembly protein PilB
VEPVICTDQQLNHLVGTIYGTYSGIGGVLEDMEYEKTEEADREALSEEVEVGIAPGHGPGGTGDPPGQLHSFPGGA